MRLVLLTLYDRARRNVPAARPLVVRYMRGFSVSAALWLLSLAFTGTPRYVIWALAMAIDIGTPLFAPQRLIRRLPIHHSHLPERFGLFTLIVLGETVVSVTAASADIEWTFRAGVVAALGFAAVACLWWIYFDLLDLAAVRRGPSSPYRAIQVYFYGHLPLLMALTGVGAGTKISIDTATEGGLDAGARAALLGGAAVALTVMAAIELVGGDATRMRRGIGRLSAAAALVVLAVGGGSLAPVAVLALMTAVLAAELATELASPAPAETLRGPSFGSEAAEGA